MWAGCPLTQCAWWPTGKLCGYFVGYCYIGVVVFPFIGLAHFGECRRMRPYGMPYEFSRMNTRCAHRLRAGREGIMTRHLADALRYSFHRFADLDLNNIY